MYLYIKMDKVEHIYLNITYPGHPVLYVLLIPLKFMFLTNSYCMTEMRI